MEAVVGGGGSRGGGGWQRVVGVSGVGGGSRDNITYVVMSHLNIIQSIMQFFLPT